MKLFRKRELEIDVDVSIDMKNGARFEVYQSRARLRSQRWRWRLVAENGKILAISSEGYSSEAVCRSIGLGVISGDYYSGD